MRHHLMIVALLFTASSAQGEPSTTVPPDSRLDFDVDFNIGFQLDRFTAAEITNALNPEDSSDNEQNSLLDIRFDYRLFASKSERQQLWLYGHSERTIRGTQVVCEDNPKFAGCAEFDGSFGQGDVPGFDTAFYILRDAQSLEAHLGLRHEFLTIFNNEAPGSLFWGVEYGFASVKDTTDLAEIYLVSVGAIVTEGRYQDSFISYGQGKNDLFLAADDRNVVRVHLQRRFDIGKWRPSVFIETEVDFDSSSGGDSVRTKLGVELLTAELFERNDGT